MDPFKLSGEIIQFGAVKIRNLEDIEVVDTYTAIVKPIYYTKMNKNVEEVTELTDEMVM
jgi:DNA polymerase III alpha subunit (gram-positive type)